jgi:hypothetical protein
MEATPMTTNDLKPGTKFQFTKLFGGMYATVGVLYVVDAACKHNINWRRINPDGTLGSGSGDSRSIVSRCEFEVMA